MVIKNKIKGYFIPSIPHNWIKNALLLKNNVNATKLALYVWYLAGVNKTKKDIIVSSGKAKEMFGISSRSFTKALNDLESLGMITTVRGVGKSPRVTVVCDDFEEVEKEAVIIGNSY
jgi:hypothetical protein